MWGRELTILQLQYSIQVRGKKVTVFVCGRDRTHVEHGYKISPRTLPLDEMQRSLKNRPHQFPRTNRLPSVNERS